MAPSRRLRIIVIGAGFGGMAAAIELRRYGFEDVIVLERGAEIGGTWHYNSYPGCACDVPSHMYQYSFAQRRRWSALCSPRREILTYLQDVAREWGVDRLVHTGTQVTRCRYSDAARRWTVSAADGREWTADAVIVATGQLHQPAIPRLPGDEGFAGRRFHSALWDHDYDLRGRHVAVIGTGASAVQFVPEVARQAARLYVYQRTGNWFLPRKNRPYPPALRLAFEHVPGLHAYRRLVVRGILESLTAMIRHPRTLGHIGKLWSTLFMRSQLRDLRVREKAWPDYTFGCKRVLFSSHYLPALQLPHVELVTEPIERLAAGGVVTNDGVERPVDCIIYGTGFRTTEFMFPMEIEGVDGQSLRERWRDGAHAHLGITIPGFPSLFLVYGPNTNTSGGSIIAYEEAQASYIRQALEQVRRHGAAAIEVRPEVEAASDRELQARFAGTAWTDCNSWYRDRDGRIVTNWPGYMFEYERRVRTLDPGDFRLIPAAEAVPMT